MRFPIATAFLLSILFSTTIYSCAATPVPVFDWFRRFLSGQDDNSDDDGNYYQSRYGPVKVIVELENPDGSGARDVGDAFMDVPTTAIRDPSPEIVASVVNGEGRRYASLINSEGKILEATLQFGQGQEGGEYDDGDDDGDDDEQQRQQQYAGLSSVVGIRVDSVLFIEVERVMPLICQLYVGDGFSSEADARDPTTPTTRAWVGVGQVFGFNRPMEANRLVDGVKCFSWVEEKEDGSFVRNADLMGLEEQRGDDIDTLLLRYLAGAV